MAVEDGSRPCRPKGIFAAFRVVKSGDAEDDCTHVADVAADVVAVEAAFDDDAVAGIGPVSKLSMNAATPSRHSENAAVAATALAAALA